MIDAQPTLEDFLEGLPDRIRSDQIEGWTARFHLRVDGDESPLWTVTIDDGRCVTERGLVGTPDCVIDTSSKVLTGIASGEINPQLAYLMGRIRVADLGLLLRLVKAFL